MRLSNYTKFQKALALSASASNQFEVEAAELAARRLMAHHRIDPTDIPDMSLYNRMNFGNNALLKKLRAEWREQHPAAVSVVPPPLVIDPPAPVHYDGFRININYKNFNKTLRENRQHQLTQKIGALLERPEGCFATDILHVTGWKTVSVPRQARYLGYRLRKERRPGEPTRYFGTRDPAITPTWHWPVKRPRRKPKLATVRQTLHDLIVQRVKMLSHGRP